mmetsp:Transcript_19221/g.23784  ORF Transcript_19221/g.23784 Transcript_19221/m.23784 type:complete len:127 (+) Transcript_19221:1483-1863(+)
MQVETEDEESRFKDALSEVLHEIEGISHFNIEHFYAFDYLQNYVNLFNPTDEELIGVWNENFQGFNSKMKEQLQRSSDKIRLVKRQNPDIKIDTYVTTRINWLYERLTQLGIKMGEERERLNTSVT